MAIDFKRKPERLAKVLRTYSKEMFDNLADADEEAVMIELLADIFEWSGRHWRSHDLLEASVVTYAKRLFGERIARYEEFANAITQQIWMDVDNPHDKAEFKELVGKSGYSKQFKDPHEFMAFYRMVIEYDWSTRLQTSFDRGGVGALIIQVHVSPNKKEGEHLRGMGNWEDAAYIQRGPKRMLGILQLICEQQEVDPPRPKKIEDPEGRSLRSVDLDGGPNAND